MPAFDKLLRRLGFVRLGTYGLVLTPEDRVQSTRPHVLEDGLSGAPIVGWQDSDLAVAELPRWGSPKETPRVMAPPPASLVASLSSQGLPKWVDAVPGESLAVLLAPAPVAPAVEPEEGIDWEQALARARAAADVAETPAVAAPVPVPAAAPAPAKSGLAPTAFLPEATVPGHRRAQPIVSAGASSVAQTSPGKVRKDPPKTVVPVAPTKVVVPALRQPTVITSAIKPAPSPASPPKLSVVPAPRPTPQPAPQPKAQPKAKTAPMAAAAAPAHVTRPMRAPTAEVLRSKTQPMEAAAIVERSGSAGPRSTAEGRCGGSIDDKPVTARQRLARGTDAPTNDDRTLTNITLPPAAEPTVTARAPKLAQIDRHSAPPVGGAARSGGAGPIAALPSIKQRMAGR